MILINRIPRIEGVRGCLLSAGRLGELGSASCQRGVFRSAKEFQSCKYIQHNLYGPAFRPLLAPAHTVAATPRSSQANKYVTVHAKDASVASQLSSDFSLDICQHLLSIIREDAVQNASINTQRSLTDAAVAEQALQWMQQSSQDGDIWLLVSCWQYKDHPDGWTGPAHAVLQLWYHKPGLYDHTLWVVDPLGWPNGQCYLSCTELENLTTKVDSRKYLQSFKVLLPTTTAGPLPKQCLGTWMIANLGPGVRLLPKRGRERFRSSVRAPELLPGSSVSDQQQNPRNPLVTGPTRRPGIRLAEPRSVSQEIRTRKASEGAIETAARYNTWCTNLQDGLSKTLGSGAAVVYQRSSGQTASEAAAAAVAAADAATAREGPPIYVLADEPDPPRDVNLHMHPITIRERIKILQKIVDGKTDMSLTHVTLEDLLAKSAVDSNPQVYDLADLSRLAEAAVHERRVGGVLSDKHKPVVPDPHRPFTITIKSAKDQKVYVVAHYEPRPLQAHQSRLALLLLQSYHTRPERYKIIRPSAPEHQAMVMCGMRLPRRGGGLTGMTYGRYIGDEGPEADQYSCATWPYLATTGGLASISSHWTWKLPETINQLNRTSAKAVSNDRQQEAHDRLSTASNGARSKAQKRAGLGSPSNFPAPCLLGAPFTTLAITHNYESELHSEPKEHSYNFITWQDVLSPGSVMTVGHFWLTHGLAFTPLPGAAMYIDVRIVTHKSDPCIVHNGLFCEEGRYGAALFIKPPVLKKNAELWANFDWELATQGEELVASVLSDSSIFGASSNPGELDDDSSDLDWPAESATVASGDDDSNGSEKLGFSSSSVCLEIDEEAAAGISEGVAGARQELVNAVLAG